LHASGKIRLVGSQQKMVMLCEVKNYVE